MSSKEWTCSERISKIKTRREKILSSIRDTKSTKKFILKNPITSPILFQGSLREKRTMQKTGECCTLIPKKGEGNGNSERSESNTGDLPCGCRVNCRGARFIFT